MPIKNLRPQLAERGKIKIGGLGEERQKKGSNEKYRPPEKYDYFLITGVQRDAVGRLLADRALMQKFAKESGPTIPEGPYKGLPVIKEIQVRLLYDDIHINFPTRYACYLGKRCWCSGDGETAQRLAEGNGNLQEVKCPCERQDPLYNGKEKCKTLGTLQVLVEGTSRIGGVWKFRTAGWNSVNAILSSMALIKTITGGPLAGIPLHMVVSPKTVTIPGTGQTMPIYVVSLEYRATGRKRLEIADGKSCEITLTAEEELVERGYEIARKRIEHRVKLDQIEAEARMMLVGPQAESPEEQAETNAEFFHDGDTDQDITEPASPGVAPRGMATVGDESAKESAKASQAALDDAATLSDKTTSSPSSESSTEPNSQSQEGKEQKAVPMTLPEVMEINKGQTFIPAFPIPLVTTKGVAIGEWVDRHFDKTLCLIFEMVPDLPKVANGLTKERISKSFKEAGYKVIFQAPGTMKQSQAQETESTPPTLPVEQVQPNASSNNGGSVPRNLF